MIFFAVASPTPGNTSIISSAVALFRSILGEAVDEALVIAFFGGFRLGFRNRFDHHHDRIVAIVRAGTPALARSSPTYKDGPR